MADIVLFHHALGLTPGCHSLADRLRADGHTVHLPDLYGGAVFDRLDDGMAHLEALGFDAVVARGCRAADDHRGPLVVAGMSLGVMPAQRLAQTRPGIVAGVFIEACAPFDAFADRWPDAVAVQVHGMDGDKFFAGEGDLDNARDLIAHAAATADAELFTYPGAAHLFVDDSTDGHDRAATNLVVERMLALLGRVDDASMATGSGSQDFEGATFFKTSFKGALMRACDLSGVTMRSADVDGLDIDGPDLSFGSLFVNGVDVVPLVDAELNRQFPGRKLQSAQTSEGLRDGWVAVQAAWATTLADTPPKMVDAHVDDEWSLAQTLRHLVLATDAWLRGGIMGIEQPFHEIGQIFTSAPETGFDMSIFRTDAPTFEEILEVRAERQQMVTDFLAGATPELLAEERNNPWGGGDWHPTIGDCVRVILEEEWAHLRYIRRDLALLA